MQITTVSDIITKRVLNENTGELERQDYQQLKKKKFIRGGFRMVYKSYDEALGAIVKSNLDLLLVIYIRDLFTYQRTENVLSKVDIAKTFPTSEQKVTSIIKKMLDVHLLKRVSRGVYRLNPYMYLPFRADAETLQLEWNDLKDS